MSRRQGLAAALRAVRSLKGLVQIDLASAAARRYIHNIEQSKSNISLAKLDEISAAAGIDTITLLVLATVASGDQPIDSVLARVTDELEAFSASGGLELLAQQFNDGPEAVKAQVRQQRAEAIQACKARGLTQQQTAEELGVPKSTVADFWSQD
ncbi:helix-turn-helix transcriptional regulator [Pseudomonas alliivorans]|uniref:helix-turn-helix domain-containing protein n=1 Tax=Pseudomonas alliivorans TaxID=2810613 RepID=UPI001AE2F261|nr:helix-turn-helix transcriptional regulator [Pseudomonas alliivorans]MBP0941017.1 helix-turn-helix transcriptional regulator [Pseudomonas alliivorans]MEE4879987.1 helix-turn-helix transcriptional regulator [Pseudomonas alliivorans]MEE4930865.1 helix-turn-helix transcriptional regulator [Pseudomonas alliivorans]MEE4936139.1 helix-turn-helix transcriptional regulator [Pseudomonas alliivorans]MEE4940709.1 helix-turn-helix transcriptional regulator [Pseudomonas alliivorans]